MVQNESLQEKWNDCFELKKPNVLFQPGSLQCGTDGKRSVTNVCNTRCLSCGMEFR